MKYELKDNIVIEAIQYTGNNITDIEDFIQNKCLEFQDIRTGDKFLGIVPRGADRGDFRILIIGDYLCKDNNSLLRIYKEGEFQNTWKPLITAD